MGKKRKEEILSLKTEDDFGDLKPYEKLELYGPEMLSNSELLAIIIKTGTKEENSVNIAQKILKLNNKFY